MVWSLERKTTLPACDRSGIRRGSLLIAATAALTVTCAPAGLNAEPLSPAAAQEAFYTRACNKLALATRSEEAPRTEMSGWDRICSAHPRRFECVNTADLIKGYKKAPALKCGQDIAKTTNIAASFLPSFDQVCANVAAVWLSGSEAQYQMEVAGWVKTCNGHPDVSACKAADDLIEETRKVRPLNCGSNGGQ
jgi:hypothetical protein